jgi:hypothetical protein
MPPVLQIAQRNVGSVTVFTLSGQLAYEEGTRVLREALTAAVADGARSCLFRHVTRRGGQFKLLRPSAAARRVLGICKLTMVFDIFDDEADALLNMGGEPPH